MRQPLAGALILCWIACGAAPSAAQFPTPQVFAGAPAAPWIFPAGVAANEFGVFHFRRVFELDAKPSRFVVHVSADNRYRLFVNGEQVSSGPQRSDLMHWRYETVDLAPHLRVGPQRARGAGLELGGREARRPVQPPTAFLLQGDSPREAVVNPGPEWKVLRNEGYAPIPVRAVPSEATTRLRRARPSTRDGTRGAGRKLDFPEEGWVAAAAGEGFRGQSERSSRAQQPLRRSRLAGSSWRAPFPPMEESPVRFATVRRD